MSLIKEIEPEVSNEIGIYCFLLKIVIIYRKKSFPAGQNLPSRNSFPSFTGEGQGGDSFW
jgi:hypothetical protein